MGNTKSKTTHPPYASAFPPTHLFTSQIAHLQDLKWAHNAACHHLALHTYEYAKAERTYNEKYAKASNICERRRTRIVLCAVFAPSMEDARKYLQMYTRAGKVLRERETVLRRPLVFLWARGAELREGVRLASLGHYNTRVALSEDERWEWDRMVGVVEGKVRVEGPEIARRRKGRWAFW